MEKPSKRSYGQFCAIARALDVVGERWTLLLVRELLAGPRRFGDLLEGLPGIGTNLLSARLRDLTAAGLIEKADLPPPASSTVYKLTARGMRLRPIIMALGSWGGAITDVPAKGDVVRPWWSLLLLNGRLYRSDITIPPETNEGFELHTGGDVHHLTITGGKPVMGQGPIASPTVVIRTDDDTIAAILGRKTSAERAIEKGRVVVEGDVKKLRRLAKILELPFD